MRQRPNSETTIPHTLVVRVDSFLERIPAEFRTSEQGDDRLQTLELPCSAIFQGNTPRIRLSILHDLLPDMVKIPDGADPGLQLPLPAGWLALHYPLFDGGKKLPVLDQDRSKEQQPPISASATGADPTPSIGTAIESGDTDAHESSVTALTLERLWKLDPEDALVDATALQSLFMTEEKLTLERVIAMAGQLPGLSACVLTHGDQVISTSSAPEGIDLRSLSNHAMTMLSQIRESSEKMGLGSVPAVTLHAEQGILSFLYQGDLCLLVLHADRGFVPGVRERLQEMLRHLTATKALPAAPTAQASLTH